MTIGFLTIKSEMVTISLLCYNNGLGFQLTKHSLLWEVALREIHSSSEVSPKIDPITRKPFPVANSDVPSSRAATMKADIKAEMVALELRLYQSQARGEVARLKPAINLQRKDNDDATDHSQKGDNTSRKKRQGS
jgi:hypothetical protein